MKEKKLIKKPKEKNLETAIQDWLDKIITNKHLPKPKR